MDDVGIAEDEGMIAVAIGIAELEQGQQLL